MKQDCVFCLPRAKMQLTALGQCLRKPRMSLVTNTETVAAAEEVLKIR